jgi:hypothetical protein
MDGWDVTLLVVGGYLATVSVVRLMVRRRDQLRTEFHQQVKKEKKRRKSVRRKKLADRERAA